MFKAMTRYLTAIGYLLTGRIDSAREALDSDPHVMRAKFDEIILQKTARIQDYKRAVAALMAQMESKLGKIRLLTDETGTLTKLKTGAKAKAMERVNLLTKQNLTKEQIQEDPEYKKCLAAFNDFSSTLEEKEKRLAELEHDVKECGKNVEDHKIQLQHLAREIEKVKQEAADSVADVIASGQEQEIADALSGISMDETNKELEQMRNVREKMKANAKISKELAGTDTKRAEAEFLEYAKQSVSNKEFENGMFDKMSDLGKDSQQKDPQKDNPAGLPEN